MHVSTIQQFVGFIHGIGIILTCPIQDDLSLYCNMLAAKWKYMDPKYKETSANRQGKLKSQGQ